VSGRKCSRAPQGRSFEAEVLPLLPKLRNRARQFTYTPNAIAAARGNHAPLHADADDLVQETMILAWQAWDRQDVENVWSWLFLILRNAFIDRYRRSARQREVTEAHASEIADVRAAPPPPPDAAATTGLDDRLVSAMQQLTSAQRDVIEMQLAGVDDHDAAERLGVSRNTIRATRSYACQKLRSLL
jgi:RNA polymerase sigma-70 factor (ECF subfamily)